jgi:hypothetical protein
MDKEYTGDINSFTELEKTLNDWFTLFKWNVDLHNENLTSLASLSQFTYSVEWSFDCVNNKLTSLKWCPTSVAKNFWCFNNNLTSLEWCPKSISWSFLCYSNELTTLEWCPNSVGWVFNCGSNQLKTLEWCPKYIGWDFYCFNNNFTSLEQIKSVIFKLNDNIYVWKANSKDIKNMMGSEINTSDGSQKYYKSFINFTQSTTKLDTKNITNTDITFNGKKYKRWLLNL